MGRRSEDAERSTGSVAKLPYEAPVLRELPVESTMTGDLSFSTEGVYTEGPFAGQSYGKPASV
jgi:hypothetical protein